MAFGFSADFLVCTGLTGLFEVGLLGVDESEAAVPFRVILRSDNLPSRPVPLTLFFLEWLILHRPYEGTLKVLVN
jgi:hypothetical protein